MSDEAPLQIGLLQCGHLHEELLPSFGDYEAVFTDLLGPFGVAISTFDVTTGELPGAASHCDGWLVSGSACSAYDPLPWIAPLEQFLRELVDEEAPLVAV